MSRTANLGHETHAMSRARQLFVERLEDRQLLTTVLFTTVSGPGTVGTAVIENDAGNPGWHVLTVTGTSRNDSITIEPQAAGSSQIRVKVNNQVAGVFPATGFQRIVATGREGNDTIVVHGALTQSATLLGGNGNDILSGGSGDDQILGGSGNDRLYGANGSDALEGEIGDDILFGGSGNDRLFGQVGDDDLFGENDNDILVGGDGADRLLGGIGADLLIGGARTDQLYGEAGDDILIAGITSYDDNSAALQAILAEWTAPGSYDERINHLRYGGGANGSFVLEDDTVMNGVPDLLSGNAGQDWFWIFNRKSLKDVAKNERVN